jgi:TDG/mug DNA glycosylase family protein
LNAVPDHIAKQLDILFVGFNPSLKSAETGHHYANPNNRFWKILFLSGLTPRIYQPEEDAELLHLGYGLTNIVSRPTKAADEITKQEYKEGRLLLKKKISVYQPKIVCYVGKGVYQQFSQNRQAGWGIQTSPVVPGTVDYVAPSSSGLVRMKMHEVVKIYQPLALLKRNRLEEQ